MDLNAIKNRLNQLQTTNNRTSNLWKPSPGNQVVRIDNRGNYVRDKGASWSAYMAQMVSIQKLMIAKFNVKARNKALTK